MPVKLTPLSDLFSEGARAYMPALYYHLAECPTSASALVRVSESEHYGAEGYRCHWFHKPITRCVPAPKRSPVLDSQEQRPEFGTPGAPRNISSDKNFFALYANCISVKGALRSIICDLQRGGYHLIPNGMQYILTELKGYSVSEIKSEFGHEYDVVIDEYFDFLIERELGFWCSDFSLFPDLDLSWERPENITNSVVDIDSNYTHNFDSLFGQLDELGCKALQLRFFTPVSPQEVGVVLDATRRGRLRSVDLLVTYSSDMHDAEWESLCTEHPRISSIVFSGSPQDHSRILHGTGVTFYYSVAEIKSNACCGQVHPGYFTSNMDSFTEAITHNSCLNRKIAVDASGEIRNCPSLARSFGNAQTVSLHDVLDSRDFKSLWSINKDQVEICKDCEFRYICTDCRAFVKNENDILSKPSKCNYNPYTSTWE